MPNSITDTSFKVLDSACEAGDDTATVERSPGRITIRGTIIGFNSCYTAELESAAYDEAADELAVVVNAYEPDGSGSCLSCELLIDYRATITFDGDAPCTVTISHDDRSVDPD